MQYASATGTLAASLTFGLFRPMKQDIGGCHAQENCLVPHIAIASRQQAAESQALGCAVLYLMGRQQSVTVAAMGLRGLMIGYVSYLRGAAQDVRPTRETDARFETRKPPELRPCELRSSCDTAINLLRSFKDAPQQAGTPLQIW